MSKSISQMKTKSKVLLAGGIWLGIVVLLFVIFGSNGKNEDFKPQNEFKLHPWISIHLGPIDLPSPEQALGGREAHSVFSYVTNGSVWSDWFFPGLHGALWIVWPVVGAAALAGLLLALIPLLFSRTSASPPRWWAENPTDSPVFGPSTSAAGRTMAGVLAIVGLVGLAAAVSWLVSPTSASGPSGMPRGFESGVRYLTPALILGLALLPTVPPLRALAARLAADMDREGRRRMVEELLGVIIGEDDPEIGLERAQPLADVGRHLAHMGDQRLVLGVRHGEKLRRVGQHGPANHRRHHGFLLAGSTANALRSGSKKYPAMPPATS